MKGTLFVVVRLPGDDLLPMNGGCGTETGCPCIAMRLPLSLSSH